MKLTQNNGLKNNIALLQKYPQKVRTKLQAVGKTQMDKVFTESQRLVPRKSGRLARSGKVIITPKGAAVVYTADYAAKIEFDTSLVHSNGQSHFVAQPFRELKTINKELIAKAAADPLR